MLDIDIDIPSQVVFCYSAFIDVHRNIHATRLTVFPTQTEATINVTQLLFALGHVWPADGGLVSLNVASESLLQDLLRTQPSPNIMVEVPSFMAVDPQNIEGIQALHEYGNTLLLKGRPLRELPREVLSCFKYSIIDFADDRRLKGLKNSYSDLRAMSHIQEGVHTLADMEISFRNQAVAIIGWPMDDLMPGSNSTKNLKAGAQTDFQVIVELIHRVEAQDPIDRLETTLKRDPPLAFKLMRYINSPAFGLRVEVNSFRHAIMLLGYHRLKRWLALLLATSSRDPNLKPVMFTAIRRGLFLEELLRNDDEDLRSEVFICGVFSLLDRMFQQPFVALFKNIPVSETVYKALVEESGPFHPYMEMVRAVESGSLYDCRKAADNLFMTFDHINQAQLRALGAAAHLN